MSHRKRISVHDGYQRGLTLVELLMVLVVIAVILMFSIHRYRDYQRRIRLAGIRSDIAAIQQALNRYYHTEGCSSDGQFKVGALSPSMAALGLSLKGRPPMVPITGSAYSAHIVKTDTETTGKKPVYALQVRIIFNKHYSNNRMVWYQKTLGAEMVLGHTLTWMALPSNTASEPATKLWVMKAEGEQFRQQENAMWQKLKLKSRVSSAYCAH